MKKLKLSDILKAGIDKTYCAALILQHYRFEKHYYKKCMTTDGAFSTAFQNHLSDLQDYADQKATENTLTGKAV